MYLLGYRGGPGARLLYESYAVFIRESLPRVIHETNNVEPPAPCRGFHDIRPTCVLWTPYVCERWKQQPLAEQRDAYGSRTSR
jgi:hypothetical protein